MKIEIPAPQTAPPVKKEILFHGIPASPGIAIGSVRVIGASTSIVSEPDKNEADTQCTANPDKEVELFERALDKTRSGIRDLQKQLQNSLEAREASIFDAHLLIVDDKMLNSEVIGLIRDKHLTAGAAFRQTIRRYIAAISSMPDQYLQERADDIRDVANRIMSNINGIERPDQYAMRDTAIIIAHELTPSDTARLDRDLVLGFAVETGSRTSHTAILARSMKIPAVVGMHNLVKKLTDGDRIIVDGYLGMVIIHPEAETESLYREKLAQKEKLYEELLKESRMRAETKDGFYVQLASNVEGLKDTEEVKRCGAEGIGLFRTEYLFMGKPELPDEETQFQVYAEIARAMQGRPVVIRTLDVGGDKLDAALTAYREPNPFLGMRAIRLALDKPQLMRTQMRAILRAGVFGDVKMLFPMVSSMSEIDTLFLMLDQVKKDMAANKITFKEPMEIGVMIEIPAAVLIADQLAKKVDFFSIGSNDLVQYTLAVDRSNEKVAYLYNPMHPAVIELIARTVKAAHDNGIWVSCCGEIAGDPRYVPLLVGLGVHELSMSSGSIAPVRRLIRRLSLHDAEDLAREILRLRDPGKAMTLSHQLIGRVAPDIAKLTKGF